jgi:hypothetical protein
LLDRVTSHGGFAEEERKMSGARRIAAAALAASLLAVGCSDEGEAAWVAIHNDFDNPEMDFNPPWTICESFYGGAELGQIAIGETSEELEVTPGLENVLMVAAWDDPSCAAEHCLPIASSSEEEVVPGQHRVIDINMPNHQGPCPPEGVEPIPQALYDQILELWPDYGFEPYDSRAENPQCQ